MRRGRQRRETRSAEALDRRLAETGQLTGGDAGEDPATGCPAAYPLCQENDPIRGIDHQDCPDFLHPVMGSANGCGTTGTGRCYKCVPDICAAVPAECQAFCSNTNCTTGCCGKDPATGQCGCNAMPIRQGALPQSNFLMRIMAQELPSRFKLLP